MCKIIDFSSKLIRESEIYWDVILDRTLNEGFCIRRNPANEQIMIFLTVDSFEHISDMHEKALTELKEQLLKNEVEYACKK